MNCAQGSFAWITLRLAGNKKTEAKTPQLEIDIVALADPESQIDPKFQTMFKYTRITAKAMREALILKTAVEHIPTNKNQHKLDKEN